MPLTFDKARVMHQIRYLGLLDNIKVRRAGFAYRTTFNKFMERYYLLSGRTSYAAKRIWKGDDISGSRAILEDSPVGPEEWQIGKTKVFLRHPETVRTFFFVSNSLCNSRLIYFLFEYSCSLWKIFASTTIII